MPQVKIFGPFGSGLCKVIGTDLISSSCTRTSVFLALFVVYAFLSPGLVDIFVKYAHDFVPLSTRLLSTALAKTL